MCMPKTAVATTGLAAMALRAGQDAQQQDDEEEYIYWSLADARNNGKDYLCGGAEYDGAQRTSSRTPQQRAPAPRRLRPCTCDAGLHHLRTCFRAPHPTCRQSVSMTLSRPNASNRMLRKESNLTLLTSCIQIASTRFGHVVLIYLSVLSPTVIEIPVLFNF